MAFNPLSAARNKTVSKCCWYMKIGLATLVVGAFLFPNAVHASPECPGSISPSQPRTQKTYWGVNLSDIVTIERQGRVYEIPAGFLWPWPERKLLDKKVQAAAFGIAFWFPALRYPERDVISVSWLRFCEPGRQNPAPNEYVVKAQVLPLPMGMYDVPPGTYGEITPLRAFMNQTRNDVWPNLSEMSREHGLLKFVAKVSTATRENYRHLPGSKMEVLISCIHRDISALNPVCKGQFLRLSDRFYFKMTFHRDGLAKWRSLVDAFEKLLKSWCVASCQ